MALRSKVLSASGEISAAAGAIYSITVEGSVAANTVEVREGSAAGVGGTVIWTGDFTPTFVDTRHYSFPEGLPFRSNSYCNIANATKVSFTLIDNA